MRFAALLLLACSPTNVEGDRRVLRSASGYQTVSMLDGGRTGLYYDFGEVAAGMRPQADLVVLLGMGGGEMLRAAHRALPHAQLVGVDVDPTAIRAAREDFRVGDFGAVALRADAAPFLASLGARSVDLLFIDVFEDDVIPDAFVSVDFFRNCHLALALDGLLLMNVYPLRRAVEVRKALKEAGFTVPTSRGMPAGNVMVLAEP